MKLFHELDLDCNVRQDSMETQFFVPDYLSFDLMQLLKLHQIPFKYYSPLRLWKQDVPDAYKMTPSTLDAAMIPYLDAGCPSPVSPALIVSHCNTDDLFHVTQQFFGPTMNALYQAFKDRQVHMLKCILQEDADTIIRHPNTKIKEHKT